MTTIRRLIVIAPALFSAAVLLAQQSPPGPAGPPPAPTAAAVAEGEKLFSQTCQSCHGPGGQGSDRGPSLAAATLVHGSTDADLFRSIRAGVPGTQMPPFAGLSDTETWGLVAYIRSLRATTPAAGAPTGDGGDAAAGETLFFDRAGCATCHDVNGRGGIVGPDLSNAGRLPPALLRQKIVDPNAPAAPAAGGRGRGGGRGGGAPVAVLVKMLDGREIRGVRRNEDTFSLQMVDTYGTLHLLDKTRLASVAVDTRSLHATDYATRLSARRDRQPGRVSRLVEGARCRQDGRRAAGCRRRHLRAPAQLEG